MIEYIVKILQDQIHLLKRHPLVSILIFILGLLVGYFISGWYYTKTIQDLNAAITRLSINTDDKIQTERNPDKIYQMGSFVGDVETVTISLENSTVVFGQITGAENFNPTIEFEYRDFKLRFISATTRQEVYSAGKKQLSLTSVICKIIGRTK